MANPKEYGFTPISAKRETKERLEEDFKQEDDDWSDTLERLMDNHENSTSADLDTDEAIPIVRDLQVTLDRLKEHLRDSDKEGMASSINRLDDQFEDLMGTLNG